MAIRTLSFSKYIYSNRVILLAGFFISMLTSILSNSYVFDKEYTASVKLQLQQQGGLASLNKSVLENVEYDKLFTQYEFVLKSNKVFNKVSENSKMEVTFEDYCRSINIARGASNIFYVTYKDSNRRIAEGKALTAATYLLQNTKKISGKVEVSLVGNPEITILPNLKNTIPLSALPGLFSMVVSFIILFFVYVYKILFFRKKITIPSIVATTVAKMDIFSGKIEGAYPISNINEIKHYFIKNKSKILVFKSNHSSIYKSLIAQNFALGFSKERYKTLLIQGDLSESFLEDSLMTSDMEGFIKRKDEKNYELWTSNLAVDKEKDFLTILKIKKDKNHFKTISAVEKFSSFFDVVVLDTGCRNEYLETVLLHTTSLTLEVKGIRHNSFKSKIA